MRPVVIEKECNATTLTAEIVAAGFVLGEETDPAARWHGLATRGPDADGHGARVELHVADDLSAEDESTMTSVVAAHVLTPLETKVAADPLALIAAQVKALSEKAGVEMPAELAALAATVDLSGGVKEPPP